MMLFRGIALRIACVALLVGFAGNADAQFLLTDSRSGGELAIGTGLPLPVPPSGAFQGGKDPASAGPAFYPDLGVRGNPAYLFGNSPTGTIMQALTTAAGGAITLPASVLTLAAGGSPRLVPVFTTNPQVYQVGTSIDYAWPAAPATLSPGGGPGPALLGTPGGGIITYDGGSKAFGGAAQFVIAPGSGAGGGRVPPNAAGDLPIATVWLNLGGLPNTAMAVGIVGASNVNSLGAPGASVNSPPQTTMFGALTPNAGPFGAINPDVFPPTICPAGCVGGALGTINSSIPLPGITGVPPLSNRVIASKGFPWTTGFITVSQPATAPPEVFFLSGTDMRVSGVGNLSMVSGALSDRFLSGPNANRGWISLQLTTPEPAAVMAATGALGALGLCHLVVRRRRRG